MVGYYMAPSWVVVSTVLTTIYSRWTSATESTAAWALQHLLKQYSISLWPNIFSSLGKCSICRDAGARIHRHQRCTGFCFWAVINKFNEEIVPWQIVCIDNSNIQVYGVSLYLCGKSVTLGSQVSDCRHSLIQLLKSAISLFMKNTLVLHAFVSIIKVTAGTRLPLVVTPPNSTIKQITGHILCYIPSSLLISLCISQDSHLCTSSL